MIGKKKLKAVDNKINTGKLGDTPFHKSALNVFVAKSNGGKTTYMENWLSSFECGDILYINADITPFNGDLTTYEACSLGTLRHACRGATEDDLIIIDTLTPYLGYLGLDVSSNIDMAIVFGAFRRLIAHTKATIVVLHHVEGDSDKLLGSPIIFEEADVVIKLVDYTDIKYLKERDIVKV